MKIRRLFIASFALLVSPGRAPATDTYFGPMNTPYQQGRGFQFADGEVSIGGYTSFRYTNERDKKPVIDLRDISILINWRPTREWRLFTEAEVGEAATIQSGKIDNDDASFDLERLYAEYTVSPELKVRFGKSLTPVGHWNLVHAAPLVWSVSRPWTSASPFARHTTGFNVNGVIRSGAADYNYVVYSDYSSSLDPDAIDKSSEGSIGVTRSENFDNGQGIRLVADLQQPELSIGLSFGHFRLTGLHDRKDYFGMDAIWQTGDTELSSAFLYRSSRHNENDEWGSYIQAATPISPNVYFFGRHEWIKNATPSLSANVSNIGFNYHPIPPVSLKLEYQYGHHNDTFVSDAWLASFDVLF